jgi:hypothetical protein
LAKVHVVFFVIAPLTFIANVKEAFKKGLTIMKNTMLMKRNLHFMVILPFIEVKGEGDVVDKLYKKQ